MPSLSPETRLTVVARLRAGETQTSIARSLGVNTKFIHDIAHQHGITPDVTLAAKTAAANAAVQAFSAVNRRLAIDLAAQRVIQALNDEPGALPAADLKNLAIALGTVIDKRRLEEGLATANTAARVAVTSGSPSAAVPLAALANLTPEELSQLEALLRKAAGSSASRAVETIDGEGRLLPDGHA